MDNSIILWDVATREPIGPLVTEDKYAIYAVAFNRNGKLASASYGVKLWDVDIKSLRSKADQVAARNLTPDEWKRFLGDRSPRATSIYGSLQKADMLAVEGDSSAGDEFRKVVELAIKSNDAEFNNVVGWRGTLDRFATIVRPACDRAIELTKDADENFNYRDTRGVARAMTGKPEEAIEDFQAFVDWLKTEEKRRLQIGGDQNKRIAAFFETTREKREEWIAKLKLKPPQIPFDDETLKTLRREKAPPSD